MSAVFVVPGISLAQTQSVASMQEELQQLLAEVNALEAQIAAQGVSAPSWCYTFDANLSIGMSGTAVTALQTALQKDGESVAANGTFDDQTAAAVTSFQEKYARAILAPYNLSNGTGYAGKSTRAELNSLFGCGRTNAPLIPVQPVGPEPVQPLVYGTSSTVTPPVPCPASGGCGNAPIIIATGTLPVPCPASGGCGNGPITATGTMPGPSLTITPSKVSDAASSPLIPGENDIDLFNVDLTAGVSSNVTVNTVNVSCGGMACANGVTNLRLEEVVANGQPISVKTWTGSTNPQLFTPNLVIPAGTTVTLALYADIASNAPVGQQMQWSLTPGGGLVTITPAGSTSGSAYGNILSIGSGASIQPTTAP